MRLIDADTLKQTFCAKCACVGCENCNINFHFEHLATTVDAEPVVRCKDCLYSWVMPKEEQNVGEYRCEFWYAEMHGDDYCSCGKRREDEVEDG